MTGSGRGEWVALPSDPGARGLFPRLLLDVHPDERVATLDARGVAIAQREDVPAGSQGAWQRERERLFHRLADADVQGPCLVREEPAAVEGHSDLVRLQSRIQDAQGCAHLRAGLGILNQ